MNNFKPPLGSLLIPGHPLSIGLKAYYALNEGSGDSLFDLSGNGATGEIAEFLWSGSGLAKSTAGSQIIKPPAGYLPLDGASEFTVSVKASTINMGADNGLFYTDLHTGGDGILLWFDNASPDHIAALVSTSGGTTGSLYSSAVVVLGQECVIDLVYDGAFVRLYIDGVEETAGDFPDALTGTVLASGDGQYRFGNSNTQERDLIGTIDYGILRNKALSPSEVAWQYREPYAMFEQFPFWLYQSAAAGGLSIPRPLSRPLSGPLGGI